MLETLDVLLHIEEFFQNLFYNIIYNSSINTTSTVEVLSEKLLCISDHRGHHLLFQLIPQIIRPYPQLHHTFKMPQKFQLDELQLYNFWLGGTNHSSINYNLTVLLIHSHTSDM